MFFSAQLFALSALPLVAAHFKLNYPTARGFDEDELGTSPCGGQNSVSQNRTLVSLNSDGSASFPVSLTMGHDEAAVQINLALGNDATTAARFNINLLATIEEEGLGAFCLPNITIPTSVNVTDGQNATVQVVTNGDPSGGLYNCADIQFTTTTVDGPSKCSNNTGVTVVAYTGTSKNANGSTSSTSSTASASSGAGNVGVASSVSFAVLAGGLSVISSIFGL